MKRRNFLLAVLSAFVSLFVRRPAQAATKETLMMSKVLQQDGSFMSPHSSKVLQQDGSFMSPHSSFYLLHAEDGSFMPPLSTCYQLTKGGQTVNVFYGGSGGSPFDKGVFDEFLNIIVNTIEYSPDLPPNLATSQHAVYGHQGEWVLYKQVVKKVEITADERGVLSNVLKLLNKNDDKFLEAGPMPIHDVWTHLQKQRRKPISSGNNVILIKARS